MAKDCRPNPWACAPDLFLKSAAIYVSEWESELSTRQEEREGKFGKRWGQKHGLQLPATGERLSASAGAPPAQLLNPTVFDGRGGNRGNARRRSGHGDSNR